MSDFSATAIGLAEESSPGVIPVNPVFELQNITGDTIDADIQTVENPDLRTDLNVTGRRAVGQTAGGGYPYAYRFDALRHPLRGVFGANFAAQPRRANRLATRITAVTAGSTTYTFTASTGVEDNSGTFIPGSLVLAEGFTNAINNGIKAVGAATATTMVPSLATTATETPPATAALSTVGFLFGVGDLVAAAGTGGYAGALTSTTTDFTTLGVQPGDMWKLGNASVGSRYAGTPANNGFVVIGAVAAHRLDLLEVPAGWAPDTGSGVSMVVFFADTLTNGVLKKTFTTEEQYTDITEYTYSRGMLPNTVSLSAAPGANLTGTVGFLGLAQDDPTTVRVSGATTLGAAVGEVLTGADTLSQVRINGVLATGGNFVTSMDATFERFEAERQGGLFVFGSSDLSIHRFRVTGTFRLYYQATSGRAIRAQAKAGAPFPISAVLVDPQGPAGARAEGFYCPRVQWSGVPRQNDNGSRAMNAGWSASVGSESGGLFATLGFCCRWFRFRYLEF